MNISIRTVILEDFESIQAVINRSMRELQRGFYEESEIETALEFIRPPLHKPKLPYCCTELLDHIRCRNQQERMRLS